MQNKKIIVSVIAIFSLLMSASPALAHVVVRPNEVGVAAFQTFTVGVPVEKDIPTTGLRLVIPEGLQHVTPNVKQGWTIDVKSEGEGEEAKVTEITWTGGSIPVGQRDEFFFSAKVPAEETTIAWKAYQTYEDGSVVSWDHEPSEQQGHDDGDSSAGPYSRTKVVNDLAASEPTATATAGESTDTRFPLVLSVVAVAISAFALSMQLRKKK
jgi:uncharacterized protein YcnI